MLRGLARAKQCPGEEKEGTFRIRTKQGVYRWVHARVKRIKVLGRDILASLHTDVTEHLKMHEFYEKVFDSLPGFVFVKERIENGAGVRFEYVYANRLLIKEFGKAKLKDIAGKTDRDFLKDMSQVRKFELSDEAVWRTGQPQQVAEECFTPDKADASERRLATIKLPFETWVFNPRAENKTYVLGVSMDITSIRGLIHRGTA